MGRRHAGRPAAPGGAGIHARLRAAIERSALMSRLTIWDADTKAELLNTTDAAEIAGALRAIDVRFERWPVAELPSGAPPEAVLEAYKPRLDAFLAETAAGTADVIQL